MIIVFGEETVQVVVFSGSRGPNSDHMATARLLGESIARKGWTVVNGGGQGLMRATLEGARTCQGRTLAVQLGHGARERGAEADLVLSMKRLVDRQRAMIEQGDAFVALPGGIGTLFEILQILALKNAGEMDPNTPLVLLGRFHENLAYLVEGVVDQGYADNHARQFFHLVDTVPQAMAVLSRAPSQN